MVKYADVYLRYSSHKQDEGLSIEYQKAGVEKYAADNNLVIKNWYIDKAKSAGKTAGRIALEEYMDKLENGEANPHFIAWADSRVFRNLGDSEYFHNVLKKQKVQYHSINNNYDLSTPEGVMFRQIQSSLDSYKLAEISKFVTASMSLMVKEKLFPGGPVPYGYKLEKVKFNGKKKHRLVPDEETRYHIVKMFEMYASGFNSVQVYDWFRTVNPNWSLDSMRKALKRTTYKGTFVYKLKDQEPLVVENFCEPLVSEELFDAVQERLQENKEKHAKKRKRQNNYYLTGYLKCENCGGNYTGNASHAKKHIYYRCNNTGKYGIRCKSLLLRKNEIDKAVFQAIVENLLTENTIKEISDKVLTDIKKAPDKAQDKKTLLARQNKLQKEIAELVQMKLNGDIDGETMVFMKKPKELELQNVKQQVKEIEHLFENAIDEDIIRKRVKAIFDTSRTFESCDDDTLQLLFKQTIDKIIVNDTQVVIHLRINLNTIWDKHGNGKPIYTLSQIIDRENLKN